MASRSFTDPDVYRLAESLADEIWNVVQTWPLDARAIIGTQLIRAADSIGANIAEGAGRGTYQDNRRYVRYARGSLNETRHWLRRAHKRGFIAAHEGGTLHALLMEPGPRLNAYLGSIGRNASERHRQYPVTNYK